MLNKYRVKFIINDTTRTLEEQNNINNSNLNVIKGQFINRLRIALFRIIDRFKSNQSLQRWQRKKSKFKKKKPFCLANIIEKIELSLT